MITWSEWEELYQTIIKAMIASEIVDENLVGLLNQLNREIFEYHNEYDSFSGYGIDREISGLHDYAMAISAAKIYFIARKLAKRAFIIMHEEILESIKRIQENSIKAEIDYGYSAIDYCIRASDFVKLKEFLTKSISRSLFVEYLLEYCFQEYVEEGKAILILAIINELGIDLHNYKNKEESPLLWAVKNHKTNILQTLIKLGADVNLPDESGKTPLFWAIKEKGNVEIAALLLKLGAKLYEAVVEDAITNKNVDIFHFLMDNYKVILPKNIPVIPINNDLDRTLNMFQLCLSKKMSLENYSLADVVVLKTPLAVNYFITRGDTLNGENKIVADFMKANYLLIFGNSLAHFAAINANQETISMLIAAGLDIHVKDPAGVTPLHYAVRFSNTEITKILIFAGADINAKDRDGKTPLHTAVEYNSFDCGKILLYAGADRDQLDSLNQRKPLDYTVGIIHRHALEWKNIFKINKRSSPNNNWKGEKVPPLTYLAASFIANSAELTKNMHYRSRLPEETSEKIEEIAIENLTPPVSTNEQGTVPWSTDDVFPEREPEDLTRMRQNSF